MGLPPEFQQRLQQKADSSQHRWRRVVQRHADATLSLEDGRRLVNFSDNDYLGLSWHPQVRQAAEMANSHYGVGAGASRLVTGNHPLYAALESRLASFKGTEDCLLFGSGYLANIGVIPALAGPGDLILADRLIHASLVDAIKLSGADFKRFAHNDIAQLEQLLEQKRDQYRHCLLLTEGVFSMDGDRAPLQDFCDLAERYDALLVVDDAHGFGVLQQGRGSANGLATNHGERLIQIGTLSKALGTYGGYVCATTPWIDYLLNFSRSVTYTTALPPATLSAALAALTVLESEPQRCDAALSHAQDFCRGVGLPEPQSAIVPYVIGESDATLKAAEALAEAGYFTVAIRPPTVPQGSARLRLTFSASHRPEQVTGLIQAIKGLSRESS